MKTYKKCTPCFRVAHCLILCSEVPNGMHLRDIYIISSKLFSASSWIHLTILRIFVYIFRTGYFYLAQSISDMATAVRNGNIVGNGDINFVTPLSQAVLTLYFAWCLFRIVGISHIPCCYSNLVTMATTVL